MKKFYLPALVFSFVFISGCSKDAFKSYDERIVGTWRITDINKIGFGSDANNLPFKEGNFVFRRDGTLTYTNTAGDVYQGTWDIRKKAVSEDEVYHSLQITAVNFTNQQVLGEYYDDINFHGSNHIKARVRSGWRDFITHLRR